MLATATSRKVNHLLHVFVLLYVYYIMCMHHLGPIVCFSCPYTLGLLETKRSGVHVQYVE